MTQRKYSKSDAVEIDGRKVRRLREHRRPITTQQELAARAGVTRGYISTLETGDRTRVSRTVAQRVAAALGVELTDLQLVLDASGVHGAGVGLVNDPSSLLSQLENAHNFEQQLSELLTRSRLTLRQRVLVERLTLENVRTLIRVLTEELESD